MLKKHKIKIFIFLIFLIISLITVKTINFRSLAFKYLPDDIKLIIKIALKEINPRAALNDYNVVFLPETQEILLDIKKTQLDFLNENSKSSSDGFYLDLYDKKNILISDMSGFFYIFKKKLLSNKSILSVNDAKNINSNLKLSSILKTLDTFTSDKENRIYISYVTKDNKNCKILNLASAEKNLEYLKFNLLFQSKECAKLILGGRIQKYELDGNSGVLLTTSDTIPDVPNNNPQNKESIFGKILFINESTKDVHVFSSGHRNPQGLLVDGELVLSTEHGPRGGDEINSIIRGKNYGWPLASYGNLYSNEILTNPFLQSHRKSDFEEPIYSFIPSIGISEIIKIDNNFSDSWKDNFLISSLRDQSIYRVRFDENYTKILFSEKIFVQSKIRDMKYDYDEKSILLALQGNYPHTIMSIKLSPNKLFKKQFKLYNKK